MLKSYVSRLILMAVLALAIVFAFHHFTKESMSVWVWAAWGLFMGMNLLVNFLSKSALKGSQTSFINFVYGSTGLRFLFSIFFIVIYLIVNDVMTKYDIGAFLFFYLLFTSFELFHLVTKLRTEK